MLLTPERILFDNFIRFFQTCSQSQIQQFIARLNGQMPEFISMLVQNFAQVKELALYLPADLIYNSIETKLTEWLDTCELAQEAYELFRSSNSDEIFTIIINKLPNLCYNSRTFCNLVSSFLAKHRQAFFLLIRKHPQLFIKDLEILYSVYTIYFATEGSNAIFSIVLDVLVVIVTSSETLYSLSRWLNSSQKLVVFNLLRDHLPSFVHDLQDVKLACTSFPKSLAKEVYEATKDMFLPLISNHHQAQNIYPFFSNVLSLGEFLADIEFNRPVVHSLRCDLTFSYNRLNPADFTLPLRSTQIHQSRLLS